MDNFDDVFTEGETYDNEETGQSIFVMAVDSIDVGEAWLAIMWVDADGNTLDADELQIDSDDYDKWIKREIQ
tara:strand:+ start:88833 stop:89048 length:216 start_codon:yes stop_codon:yes gene_type:complete